MLLISDNSSPKVCCSLPLTGLVCEGREWMCSVINWGKCETIFVWTKMKRLAYSVICLLLFCCDNSLSSRGSTGKAENSLGSISAEKHPPMIVGLSLPWNRTKGLSCWALLQKGQWWGNPLVKSGRTQVWWMAHSWLSCPNLLSWYAIILCTPTTQMSWMAVWLSIAYSQKWKASWQRSDIVAPFVDVKNSFCAVCLNEIHFPAKENGKRIIDTTDCFER